MKALRTTLLVLIRPRKAFERLRDGQRGIWLTAFAVLLISSLVHIHSSLPHILDMQEQANAQAAEDTDAMEVPPLPEDAQAAIRTATIVSAYVFGPLAIAGVVLILAALVMVIARSWGGVASWSAALGVVLLAKMPDVVRSVLQSGYTALTGEWVAHQGLSGLVADGASPAIPTVAYSFLALIDVFFFWHLALFTIGLIVALQMPKRRAMIVVGVYFMLAVAIAVIPTAIAFGFAPQV